LATFQGFLTKLTSKSGSGKRGPWTVYSGRVEKDDGTEYDNWLGFGFDSPPCKEGDYVKIEAEKDAKGYFKVSKVEVLKNPPAKSAPVATATGQKEGSYVDNRQSSIHYQSSRKDAIEIVKTLISMDALPITAAKTKAGEAKRYEEIMALVDKLTVRYFHDTQSQRLLESVADEGATEADLGAVLALGAGEAIGEDDA
jgi:hypothetical protein